MPKERTILVVLLLLSALDAAGSSARRELHVEDVVVIDSVVFGDVTSIALPAPDRVLVLDQMSAAYSVIDIKSGALLRTVGRSGQGPGEFTRPTLLAADPEAGAAVFDPLAGMRLSTFSRDSHEYKESFRPSVQELGLPTQLVRTPTGFLIVGSPTPVLPGGRSTSRRQQAALLKVSNVGAVSQPLYEWDDIVGVPIAEVPLNPFPPMPLFAYLENAGEDGSALIAVSSTTSYVVALLDAQGVEVGRIAPDVTPEPFPEELKAQVRSQLQPMLRARSDAQIRFPAHLPAITAILPGPSGTLVVVTGDARERQAVWEVWSVSTKEKLGSIVAPQEFLPMAARFGLVAGRISTADGNWTVKVVRIVNGFGG